MEVPAEVFPPEEGVGVLTELLGLLEEQPVNAAVQAATASIDAKILFIIRFIPFITCFRKNSDISTAVRLQIPIQVLYINP